MSSQSQPKITPKNLSYSSDLPPFLARLRGQHQQQQDSDSPDPILAARRRTARPRSASEEAEDAPLVVDENGNTVTFPSGADEDAPSETKGEDIGGKDDEKRDNSKEKIAGIGAGKKRKMGRVVGGGGEEEDGEENTTKATGRPKENKHTADPNSKDTKSTTKQGKKKAKKIKLSFGDDGD
ncbi:hypothetical protein M434DRAFT_253139 [Hypoxylon sp. CO27-5]|nr:hypothetical protein M434DRAFT_253139 [Hypoxylon sp. CO27-5]